MRFGKLIFSTLFLFVCFGICLAQETQSEAVLHNEMVETYCTEKIAYVLDTYVYELQKEPSSMAYIVFYGKTGQNGKNELYQSYFKNYLIHSRGVDQNRIVILRGENRSKMIFQLWQVSLGVNLPQPEKDFVNEKITSTIRYDKDWADIVRYNGKLSIDPEGFSNWGCNAGVNMSGFAKVLLSEPKITGYIIVYTEFGKNKTRSNKVAKLAANKLEKIHKVPRTRLKTIYGGNRNEPEMELWLVPEGAQPPVPTPDRYKTKEN